MGGRAKVARPASVSFFSFPLFFFFPLRDNDHGEDI